jgi:hypothetical protein
MKRRTAESRYPDSDILVIGYIRVYLHPPCRHSDKQRKS